MSAPEFHLFLPQMRLSIDALVERARAAEAAGFTGMALMDHLAPPAALDQPMYEAMTAATWLLARTERLVLGHLVLCDAFRHPAVLARQAVTLDHASGGRYELGIGWGSVPDELVTYGVADPAAKRRVARFAESLDVITALWRGEAVEYDGEWFTLQAARQLPKPLSHIPILIGGAGPKTLAQVAKHADWWNLPINDLHRFDDLRGAAGSARVSVQQMVSFIPDEARRDEITAVTMKRFGHWTANGEALRIGNATELIERFSGLRDKGVERFYVWFTDFAAPDTLAAFGAQVISAFA